MFCVERRVSLVLYQDLSRLVVHLRIVVVFELIVSGCNEGRFERLLVGILYVGLVH